MQYFAVIVHQEDGSAFGLSFPDLPGCFSAADHWKDIPAKAAEALDLYFEDQPIPEARALDVIRDLPDTRAALAEGGTLLVLPYIEPAGAQVRVNLSLDASLLKAIDGAAEAKGVTRSSFLAHLARREITGI